MCTCCGHYPIPDKHKNTKICDSFSASPAPSRQAPLINRGRSCYGSYYSARLTLCEAGSLSSHRHGTHMSYRYTEPIVRLRRPIFKHRFENTIYGFRKCRWWLLSTCKRNRIWWPAGIRWYPLEWLNSACTDIFSVTLCCDEHLDAQLFDCYH